MLMFLYNKIFKIDLNLQFRKYETKKINFYLNYNIKNIFIINIVKNYKLNLNLFIFENYKNSYNINYTNTFLRNIIFFNNYIYILNKSINIKKYITFNEEKICKF